MFAKRFVCLFCLLAFLYSIYNLRLLENFSIISISFGPIFTGFLKRKDQTDMIEVSILRWRIQEGDQVGSWRSDKR